MEAERFCDGALLDFFKSGYILKWLERLNSIEYRRFDYGYKQNENSVV
ncbi:DUF6508 domain-containing protein [Lysinibacillus cavernae]|nr:DUF6508 domain-containing protein [Lysinibacillus cavernae]